MVNKVKVARIFLAISFLFFGVAKLIISPTETVPVFGQIGGATAQYLTGAYQILAAIFLFMPSTAFIGALLVVISMAVALILHFTVIGFAGELLFITIFAFVLLVIGIYVMKNTKKDLFKKKVSVRKRK